MFCNDRSNMHVGISSEVCRARYDHIAFAQGSSSDSSSSNSSSGSSTGNASSCRERRWLLELGAMTVLEAELETLSVDEAAYTAGDGGRTEGGGSCNNSSSRDIESYKSCLEAMLDEHYDALGDVDHNINTSIPTSLLDTITKASSTAAPITISEEGCSGAFRPVEVSTMLGVLPGLMVERGPLLSTAATMTARRSSTAAGERQAVSSGAGDVGGGVGSGADGGASAATIKPASQGGDGSRTIPSLRRGTANSSDDVANDASDRKDQRFSQTSSSRSNGNNHAISQPLEAPQHQIRQGAPVAADGGAVNPYAVPPASRSAGRSTDSSATTTPFPPSNVRGVGRTPVQGFPGSEGAGLDGGERRSSPSNGYENRAPPGDVGAGGRNVFGGPSSGPVLSQGRSRHQHHQQHQQHQHHHQQHHQQQHQQQTTPRYGDRNPARGALLPAGGGGGRDPHATADAWAARDPTPVRGGLYEAGGGMGPGRSSSSSSSITGTVHSRPPESSELRTSLRVEVEVAAAAATTPRGEEEGSSSEVGTGEIAGEGERGAAVAPAEIRDTVLAVAATATSTAAPSTITVTAGTAAAAALTTRRTRGGDRDLPSPPGYPTGPASFENGSSFPQDGLITTTTTTTTAEASSPDQPLLVHEGAAARAVARAQAVAAAAERMARRNCRRSCSTSKRPWWRRFCR
ncbi:unnamed protein product [Ectocarpus sp. 13 AM-2016]